MDLAHYELSPARHPVARVVQQIEREAYIRALKDHDWSYEFSDDHGAWKAGRDSLRELQAMQRELDPAFEVWNRWCHPKCINGGVYF